jgi:hypothetical protein
MRVRRTKHGYAVKCPACKQEHVFGFSWSFNGDYLNPTFSPSLLIKMGKKKKRFCCHFTVSNGVAHFCGDCTHELKSQDVELLYFEEPKNDRRTESIRVGVSGLCG